MNLELSDEETAALAAYLKRTIRDDSFPLSPRIRTLQGVLDKLDPPPAREPLPPPKVYAPPRAVAARRGRAVR
jgi:hypothetical protein